MLILKPSVIRVEKTISPGHDQQKPKEVYGLDPVSDFGDNSDINFSLV